MKRTVAVLLTLLMAVLCCQPLAESNPYAVTEPVTIEWWHALEDQYTEDITRIVGDFNKLHPNVKVEPVYIGSYADVNTKLIAAITAGDVPAVSAASVEYLSEYFASGICEKLDPYLEAYGIDKSDYVEGYLRTATWEEDGAMYSLPFQASTQVIYYNQSVAKAEGIPLPEKWEDMDAFLKAATKFGEGGETARWGLIIAGWQPHYFQTLFTNYGVEIVKEDGLSTGIADGVSVEITKQIKDWIDKGYCYFAYGSGASSNMRQLFWDQKAFAVIHTCSLITTYQSKIADAFEFNIMGFPEHNGRKETLLSGNHLIIPKKAGQAQKNAAFLFANYMTSGDASLFWAQVSGYLPGRYTAMQGSVYDALLEKTPAFEGIFRNVANIQPRDNSEYFNNVADEWMNGLAKIFCEDYPVEETLRETAEIINEILADQ